jgi:F-type H+-transporting ATPase subunit alpha
LNAKHSDTLATLKAGKLTDEAVATLETVAKEVAVKFN